MLLSLDSLIPLYVEPDLGGLIDEYERHLRASTESGTSYASEDEYLVTAKAVYEKEESRFTSLRNSASASVTLTVTLLAGYVAFGDQYPPISQIRSGASGREIFFALVVLVAGLYLVASVYQAVRVLGTNPRYVIGPEEFLPSAHLVDSAERKGRNQRTLAYSEWLAANYAEATINNYVVDARIAGRVRVSRSALGVALVLLVLATLFNSLTQPEASKDTIICVVDTPESVQLCAEDE